MPCPKCRYIGDAGVKAVHDVVNVKLGKPLYDKENFLRFRDYVDRAADVVEGKANRDKLLEEIATDMTNGGIIGTCKSCNLNHQTVQSDKNSFESIAPAIIIGGLFVGIIVWGMS